MVLAIGNSAVRQLVAGGRIVGLVQEEADSASHRGHDQNVGLGVVLVVLDEVCGAVEKLTE